MAKAKMGNSQLCSFISLFLESLKEDNKIAPKYNSWEPPESSQMQGSDDSGDSTAFPKLSQSQLYTALIAVPKEGNFTGRFIGDKIRVKKSS